MEYCESGDLRSILKKPIKEKYAQFYFCQLANGLKYLDKHSIIHRDMKPKNILLTANRKVLKICDFGFAKKDTTQYKPTLHDTICGSPLYMAPEIMNHKLYNNQTDLWSIGMILYEMLYGFHPFAQCKSLTELKDKLYTNEIIIPPIGTKNKDVSKECIDLLTNLLQKRATTRITWKNFFDNPWVNAYNYTIPKSEYEKQLVSTSLGSSSHIGSTPPI